MKKLISFLVAQALAISAFAAMPAAQAAQTVSEDTIVVQAEEPAALTQNGVDKELTQESLGSVADLPKVYAADADPQPACGETGDGVQIASWGSKIYSVTLRSANGGIDSLTYKVTAPAAGTYSLSVRAGVWQNVVPTATVNGTPVTLSALYQNLENWKLISESFYDSKDVAVVTLKKGENEITLTTNKDFYFDAFSLTPIDVQYEIEYYVNGEKTREIAPGELSVTVNHGAYEDGKTIAGAVYAGKKLYAVRTAALDGESTSFDFGTIPAAEEQYSFKYFAFSDFVNLIPAKHKDLNAGMITVQAEEFISAMTTKNGEDVTYTEFTQDNFGAGDIWGLFYDGGAAPDKGETGDGVTVTNYNRKVYSFIFRPHGSGLFQTTYQVTVPESAIYSIGARAGAWKTGTKLTATVNGTEYSLKSLTKNLSDEKLTAGQDHFVVSNNLAAIPLQAGENTISFTTNNHVYFDAFYLTPQDKTVPFRVELEEFDSYTIGGDVFTTYQELGAKYSEKNCFNKGISGEGVLVNASTPSKAIVYHKENNPGTGTYTVNAPADGNYKVSIFARSFSEGQDYIMMNDGVIYASPLNYAAAVGDGGDAGFALTEFNAPIHLNAGPNTITITGGDIFADYLEFTYVG